MQIMRICCGEMGLIRILGELVRLFIVLINNGYLVTNKSAANVSSAGLSFISAFVYTMTRSKAQLKESDFIRILI